MIDLKQEIILTRPRENSGPTVSNRFDYQKNWAICKILDLHEKPDDYLLTLEYFDDIIVFDSASDPTKISFYQIKTNKSQHWTLNSLLSRKKGKNGLLNSHIGKLYDHIEKFGEAVKSLNFITNNRIKGKLKSNINCEDTDGFCCIDLEKEELDKIIKCLKQEHSLNEVKDFERLTYFKLGELSIDQHTQITKGLMSEFIDRYLPNVSYKISPLYKSIFDEIKIKSDYEKVVLNFEDLKSKKSISRADFDSYLQVLSNNTDFKQSRISIENRLNAEGVGFDKIKLFKVHSASYEIKRMTYNDKGLKSIEKLIEKSIIDLNIDLSRGLYNCMNDILLEIQDTIKLNPTIDIELVRSIILHKIYE